MTTYTCYRTITYAKNAAVEAESGALGVHDVTILLALNLGHEGSLVEVGVELLGLAILSGLAGVKALKTVLLQGVQKDVLSHLQTGNELQQVLVGLSLGSIKLVLGNSKEGAVKVVNGLKKVASKALDSEVARVLHVTLGALLQVEEVGLRAEQLVLMKELEICKAPLTTVEGVARIEPGARVGRGALPSAQ